MPLARECTVEAAASPYVSVEDDPLGFIQDNLTIEYLAAFEGPSIDTVIDLDSLVVIMIESTSVATAMGWVRAIIFHLEASVIGIPLAADIGVVAAAVDGADIVLTPHAVEHLGILASIIKIVSAIVEIESAVGYLHMLVELAFFLFAIRRHGLAV